MSTGWPQVPLRFIALDWCDGPFGSGIASDHYRDEGARVIRLQNIRTDGFDSSDSAFIDLEYFKRDLLRHSVSAGDVLIAGLGDDNNHLGRACVAPADLGPALVKADCFRFRLDSKKAYPRFVAYALSSTAQLAAGTLSSGSTRQRITLSTMAGRKLSLPERSVQERIANFLDDKTARIDALIAEKERLMATLAQLRRESVDQAVLGSEIPARGMALKGLDSLGPIPASWSASRLKFEIDYVTSGSRGWADFYSDDGALFIRIGNLTRDTIELDLNDIQRVTLPDAAEGIRARVLPGDLLISITAYLGSVAVASAELEEAYVSQHVSLARPNGGRALSKWLGYVVLSSIGKTFFEIQAYGGTKVQLSLEDIRELPVPLPSIPEQHRRIDLLEKRLAQLRKLSEHATEHIERLREYRSSLISAAVTGQLDLGMPTEPRKAA